MFAYSYVHFPAAGLYDVQSLEKFAKTLKNCHIYFIGFLPRVSVLNSKQEGSVVSVELGFLTERRWVSWDFPAGYRLKELDGFWFVEGEDGQRYAPTEEQILLRLREQHGPLQFDVKYIGQSYGREGSRSALDRLISHETLQKIALRRAPSGYVLTLLLVEVHPANQVLTILNPYAEEEDADGSRIQAGLEKLYGTSERERIALYEAAMIRYFRPEYNIEFKDSFPSTRLKLLQDCYDKDFSAVVAEFCFDDIPFVLKSESVQAAAYHIVKHSLHTDSDRRMFFSNEAAGR
jgi:hypothetical protein